MNNVVDLRPPAAQPLKCPGVGRDKDCDKALAFYFSRPVTDDEMRFLHEVMQRSVALIPSDVNRRGRNDRHLHHHRQRRRAAIPQASLG